MNFKRRLLNNKMERGFTLIELLVVIAIIGVLASVVLASLADARKSGEDAKRSQDLASVKIALELYYSGHNSYPPLSRADASGSSQNIAESADRKVLAQAEPNLITPFIKIAEAQSLAAECSNFNTMAGTLVTEGLLSSIPQAPDASNCYKAWESSDLLSVYTYTSTRYQFTTANKKIGFVLTKPSGSFAGSSGESSEVLKASCLGTGNDYGDTYPTFNPQASGSAMCDGELIADKVMGVTGGSEMSEDGGEIITTEGSCSDPQYSTQEECEMDRSACSGGGEGEFTSPSACTDAMCGGSAGSCSDPAYSNESTCEASVCVAGAAGSCSDGAYSNEADCEAATCGDEGHCDSSSYNTQTECEEATCVMGNDYCNGDVSLQSPSECTSAMCGGSSAYCDMGYGDPSDCTSNGGTWYEEVPGENCGYNWVTAYPSNCGYNWYPSPVACVWTPGEGDPTYCTWTDAVEPELCGYEWNDVPGGIWTE